MRKEGIIFLVFFVLLGVVSAAPCENRYQITSSCECNGATVSSGYCCYYSVYPTTNITYQSSQQCGYTEVSPHWGHILTYKEDYNYWYPANEQREDIWASKHFDGMISGTGIKMLYNPKLDVYAYQIDMTQFSDDYSNEYQRMLDFANANGYNIEDAFLHASQDSVIGGFAPACNGGGKFPTGYVNVPGCTDATRSVSCRLKVCDWNTARWLINPKSALSKAYYAYQFTNLTTTLDSNGYAKKGVFLDEHPYISTGYSDNNFTGGGILEYGGNNWNSAGFSNLYYPDFNVFLSAVKTGMPAGKKLIPNHATYSEQPEAVSQSMASDGAWFEFNLNPGTPDYTMVNRFNASDFLTAAGKIVVWATLGKKAATQGLPVDDYGYTYPTGYSPGSYFNNANRSRLVELVFYYLAKDAANKLVYFNILGAWSNSQDPAYSYWTYNLSWTYAAEVDIGIPIGHWYTYKSGTDPNGQGYNVWARNFTKALVLVRPRTGWSYSSYDDTSKITVNLPQMMTPIDAEGNPMSQRNTFDLRNIEAAILLYSTGPSPDVNSDGNINIKDLSIVIFNQGRNAADPNYNHLDLNSDSLINWNDVQIVMGNI